MTLFGDKIETKIFIKPRLFLKGSDDARYFKILMAALVLNCFTTPLLATEATDRASSFYAAGDNPDFPAKIVAQFCDGQV